MTREPGTARAAGPHASTGPVVLGRHEIRERIGELGSSITSHYRGRDDVDAGGREGDREALLDGRALLVIGVLKGAFVFMADLVRVFDLPVEIDFLSVSSYGSGTESSGKVTLEHEPRIPVRDRDVLLVEDIVDSGNTVDRLRRFLEERGARSVEVCTLLIKGEKAHGEEPRWVGFDVPDEFLVGYGMDYDENFRHLADIASFQKQLHSDGR